jgi:hypothetical protein
MDLSSIKMKVDNHPLFIRKMRLKIKTLDYEILNKFNLWAAHTPLDRLDLQTPSKGNLLTRMNLHFPHLLPQGNYNVIQ